MFMTVASNGQNFKLWLCLRLHKIRTTLFNLFKVRALNSDKDDFKICCKMKQKSKSTRRTSTPMWAINSCQIRPSQIRQIYKKLDLTHSLLSFTILNNLTTERFFHSYFGNSDRPFYLLRDSSMVQFNQQVLALI